MGSIKQISKKTEQEELQAPSGLDSAAYQRPQHYQDDVEMDAIERLKSNILMLDDLQKRLGFMNSEIQEIIGSRKK